MAGSAVMLVMNAIIMPAPAILPSRKCPVVGRRKHRKPAAAAIAASDSGTAQTAGCALQRERQILVLEMLGTVADA